ncbi:methyltransferase [Micromonospora sp. NPDC047548]|uniref:methyltransferase n=1 Tax=Micromonospora sp. NPDC047548 TaxID=3155624 RepID=UPI003408001E
MIHEAEHLQLIIHGATAFELLRTALEFELFEKIEADGGMSLPAVAASLGVEEQPARILLLGLASLRLLRREGENYVNTPLTRRSLLPKRAGYLGPLVEIQEKITNPGLVDFADSIRRNTNVGLRHVEGPGTTLYERVTTNPALQQVFYNNMGHASRQTFPLVAETFDFSALHHLVDIGGGDGSNSIAVAKRHPHLEMTIFDQETVLNIAKQNAVDAGVGDRVHGWPGDLFTDPLPTGIDGILFCHIFEIWSLERNTELLRKCYEALPPGGAVLVYNFVSDDDNTGSPPAAFMSVYFLTIASGEGMVYSVQDMKTALRDAGFSRVERHEGVGFHHALMVGYK